MKNKTKLEEFLWKCDAEVYENYFRSSMMVQIEDAV